MNYRGTIGFDTLPGPRKYQSKHSIAMPRRLGTQALPQLCSLFSATWIHRHLGWGKNHSYQAAVLVVKNIASSEWLGFFHNDKVGWWGWLMADRKWDDMRWNLRGLSVSASLSCYFTSLSLPVFASCGILNHWLVVWNIFYFPQYIGNNHPNWLIFFRRVETTNQII